MRRCAPWFSCAPPTAVIAMGTSCSRSARLRAVTTTSVTEMAEAAALGAASAARAGAPLRAVEHSSPPRPSIRPAVDRAFPDIPLALSVGSITFRLCNVND